MSLYSVAAGLAVDCVRQAQPALVHALVDCLGEFVRKTLATWLRRRGGWVRAREGPGRGWLSAWAPAGGVTGWRGSCSLAPRLTCPLCSRCMPTPPELSLLPAHRGCQSHVPTLVSGSPITCPVLAQPGAAGSGAFFVEWVVAELCAAHRPRGATVEAGEGKGREGLTA